MAKPRPRIYSPKAPPCESVLLSDLAKRILAAAAARTGAGKSNVVEHLLRMYGGHVTRDELAPLRE